MGSCGPVPPWFHPFQPMMTGQFSYQMSGYPASLQECLSAMEESPVYQDLPPSLRFVAELILDELASNTIKYGGLDCHRIDFLLAFDGDLMRVELVDDAMPFDPWGEAPRVDDSGVLGIDDLEIGGRGIHMLRQATDTQRYERKDGKNINVMTRQARRPLQNAAA
jgi:anti-sigma regulatory factor (Ser/Thr protein kinase)